jgi:hypothetical protein
MAHELRDDGELLVLRQGRERAELGRAVGRRARRRGGNRVRGRRHLRSELGPKTLAKGWLGWAGRDREEEDGVG